MVLDYDRDDFASRLQAHCETVICEDCCFHSIPTECAHLSQTFEDCLYYLYQEDIDR